jgi:hypothetical protein
MKQSATLLPIRGNHFSTCSKMRNFNWSINTVAGGSSNSGHGGFRLEKILHFCSTKHFLRNKNSLPALPDLNAGKL